MTNYTIEQFRDDVKKMNYRNACNINRYSYEAHIYGMVEGGEYKGMKLNALEDRLYHSYILFSETMMNGSEKECDEIQDVMEAYDKKRHSLAG